MRMYTRKLKITSCHASSSNNHISHHLMQQQFSHNIHVQYNTWNTFSTIQIIAIFHTFMLFYVFSAAAAVAFILYAFSCL